MQPPPPSIGSRMMQAMRSALASITAAELRYTPGACRSYSGTTPSISVIALTNPASPTVNWPKAALNVTQAPSPKPATEFAPLRGRKVLVFSDSRQVAARLAPTLQNFFDVFERNRFDTYFINSVIVSGLATLIAILVVRGVLAK